MKIFAANKILLRTLCLLCPMLWLVSCGDKDVPDEPEQSLTFRTVLVYMAANNNLGSGGYDALDISEMQEAVDNGDLSPMQGMKGRLLVYHADYNAQPRLLELLPGENPVELKVYSYSDGISLTKTRMSEVMADMRELAAAQSYGLVLWSHGTGWVAPSAGYDANTPAPLSFGEDKHKGMSIPDLAEALTGAELSWIYFDCCLMANVETVYQLRKVTPLVVASGTELPGYGMPYDRNVKAFFAKDADLVSAARNTFEYYDGPDSPYRACTMSVLDLEKIGALGDATRKVMQTGVLAAADYVPVKYTNLYDYTNNCDVSATIFDMGHYINHLDLDADMSAAWNRAYNDVILYHAATPTYGKLPMDEYSGLGCNIIHDLNDAMSNGYSDLDWWKDVVSANPSIK